MVLEGLFRVEHRQVDRSSVVCNGWHSPRDRDMGCITGRKGQGRCIPGVCSLSMCRILEILNPLARAQCLMLSPPAHRTGTLLEGCKEHHCHAGSCDISFCGIGASDT